MTAAPLRQDAPPAEVTALRTEFTPLLLHLPEDVDPQRAHFRLSPDGALLAVTHRSGVLCLFALDEDIALREPLRCESTDIPPGPVIWSPRGDALLYLRDRIPAVAEPELWLLEVDGDGPINLLADDAASGGDDALPVRFAVWSTDGDEILFARLDNSGDDPMHRLFSHNLADAETVDLDVTLTGQVTDLDWSSRTGQVIYTVDDRTGGGVHRLDLASGESSTLLAAPRGVTFPTIAFAPDGAAVLALQQGIEDNRRTDLIVLDPASGQTLRLDFDLDILAASWSPDGHSLVYWTAGTAGGLFLRHPWWTDAEPIYLGYYRPTAALVDAAYDPFWRAQNRFLTYDEDNTPGLLRVDGIPTSADAGSALPPDIAFNAPPGWEMSATPFAFDLEKAAPDLALVSFSPTLEFVLLRDPEQETTICLLSLPADDEPACYPQDGTILPGSLRWATDGRHLVLAVRGDQGNQQLLVDVFTGEGVPLLDMREAVGWTPNWLPLTWRRRRRNRGTAPRRSAAKRSGTRRHGTRHHAPCHIRRVGPAAGLHHRRRRNHHPVGRRSGRTDTAGGALSPSPTPVT
ncbi:MAG: hypothetical protein R2856_10830 [Caldilineaceae bacterium]